MAKSENLFKKYHRRVLKEGILKAVFCGVITGCAALLVSAFFSWFFGFRAGLWLSLGLFAVGVAVAAPAFYYLKFRPTTQQIARRVDELGLEERLVTMIEYENDDSYMAKCQREDAQRALGSVDHMMIKIVISTALILILSFAVFAGLSMTTVSSLYYAGVIPSGIELVKGEEIVPTYTLQYESGEGGEVYFYSDDVSGIKLVDGPISIQEGEDAPAVYAYAGLDWVFVQWSDGIQSPYRRDLNVQADMKVTAVFRALDEEVPPDDSEMDPNGDGDGEGGESNEDAPPSDGEGDPSQNADHQPPQNPENNASGQHSDTNKQVHDGETFVGDVYDDTYDRTMDRLGSDDNIGDDLKSGISDYLDGIDRSGGGNEGGDGGTGGTGSGQGGD